MNLVMKLSKLCNLRCVYCYEYEELIQRDRMSLDRLGRFLASLADFYLDEGLTQVLQFALHGGEPLLLPEQYLREFCALQERHLGERGVPYRNALQTNLYRVSTDRIELLEELGIRIGVSLDVYGAQRVDARGRDADSRVRAQLIELVESGTFARIGGGGICVMHAGNVGRAEEVFHFFDDLGLDYRILPIFSMTEPPVRMRHLMLSASEVVEALQRVVLEQLKSGRNAVTVHPLRDYLVAAVRYLGDRPEAIHDPAAGEWALIINTNGDVYNHAEAYDPAFCMGNVFTQSFGEIMGSPGRARALEARALRARLCAECRFGQSCTRIPVVEALPSERSHDEHGRLQCPIARPMIEFMVTLIGQVPGAAEMVDSLTNATSAEAEC